MDSTLRGGRKADIEWFFEMVVSRSDESAQGHLNDHKLQEARVAKSKDALDAVSDKGMLWEM